MPYPTRRPTLYQRLLATGCEIDHHETDLYVPRTPVTTSVIKAYEAEGGISNKRPISSAIDGTPWYDLPFHFDPGWRGSRPASYAEGKPLFAETFEAIGPREWGGRTRDGDRFRILQNDEGLLITVGSGDTMDTEAVDLFLVDLNGIHPAEHDLSDAAVQALANIHLQKVEPAPNAPGMR